MSEELKRCPFCGCADIGTHLEWSMICTNCGAEGALEDTKEAAITAWNRRATPPPPNPDKRLAWVELGAHKADTVEFLDGTRLRLDESEQIVGIAPSSSTAEVDELRAAADAVVRRWDSPLWKTESTAELIHHLRAALASNTAERGITDAMADAGAEVLWDGTRAQAIEWAKQDKFDSCADQDRAMSKAKQQEG